MFGANLVCRGVEIDEIAALYVDRANAQAHASGIDTVEIDELLER